MPVVEKSSRAETDAIEIWLHIADDNPAAADELLIKFEHRLESLARMPESAEAVPMFGKSMHRSVVGNYVLYYRPVTNGIQLVRILHSARRPEELL